MDLNALVNSTAFWIVLAVIVIALILIGIITAGKKRKESKTISFEKVEEPKELTQQEKSGNYQACLLYTSPSPRDATLSRMPSSA